MTDKVTRRGLIGGLLAGVMGVFAGKRTLAESEVLWEEPEEEIGDGCEWDDTDEEESSSSSSFSSLSFPTSGWAG